MGNSRDKYIPILMGSREQAFFPKLWENINMNDTFAQRLRYLRSEQGIGQIALARAIGVGKSIISQWELGRCEPTLSKLILLAEYFGVTLDYLAGLVEY